MNKLRWVILPVIAMALAVGCTGPGSNSNSPSSGSGDTSSSQPSYDPATEVVINETSVPEQVYVRDTFKVTATVTPATANPAVTWTSSNTSVATIDNEGNFAAIGVGATTIKATTENGLKASKQIKVKEYVPVESISVGKTSVNLAADGGFHYMDAVVGPEMATNKKVNYTSSNEAVAVVDANGMVTAKAAGNAVITAKAAGDESKTATTSVTVAASSWNNKQVVDVNENGKVDFQDVNNAAGSDAMPVGKCSNIELLVVPVEFPDYPFTSQMLADINTLFNGNGAQDTRYWESVSSYYNKASYGKINMHVTVAEKYAVTDNAKDVKTGVRYSLNLAPTVLTKYKTDHNTDGTEFDADHDGYIDTLYMIYSAPDYSKVSSLDNELFWAYRHATGASKNTSSPTVNSYMWASQDFMYTNGTSRVDAHTFIHETGHLMGANDYYNYNKASSRSPLGGIDMMDHNIGDHNVWTKMAYGWLDPIYVNGNAKVTIRTAQQYPEAVLIKDGWNGTAFDEVIMLELSTPTVLNELDSKTPYDSRPIVYDQPGIKMYHVDNRLGKRVGGRVQWFEGTPTKSNIGSYSTVTANSDNSERNDTAPDYFYECGLIQAGKKATMLKNGASGTNADLFHTGDYFRFSDYQEFFLKETTFDDGSTFDYQIYFESVTATEATIVIQKVSA